MDELSPEIVDLAQKSGLNFMDRDGEKYGVQVFGTSPFHRPPMVESAGREIIVHGVESRILWRLRFQYFYKKTEEGLLFYYVPLPSELEIPNEWYHATKD